MLFCDTPLQSALAALGSGLVGGFVGLTAGFGLPETALLAGVLAGLADLAVHVVRGDAQFRAAVSRVR